MKTLTRPTLRTIPSAQLQRVMGGSAPDRLGYREIQSLMSQFNEANTLASNYQKAHSDAQNNNNHKMG